MKQCTKCKEDKPPAGFSKNKATKDGLATVCKVCRNVEAKVRYESQDYKDQLKETKQRMIDKARKYVYDYLLSHPCSCGESDPVCLDFDHLDESSKKEDVSRMIHQGNAVSTIQAEVEKCRVLCANCHRKRTARQFSWWKLEQ